MVTLEEFELRPGEHREMKLSVHEGSRYVGVLAAYRDLPESNWRVVIPLQEQERNSSELVLDAQGIKALDDKAKEED